MGICGSTGAGDDGKPLNQPGRPRSDSLSRKELKPEPMGACGGCCRLFADAWRFDNFDFDLEGADWRHSFSSSRLFASSGTLLALRFFIAVGMTVVLALSMADYSHAAKLKFWPIYVSSWSNFLGMLYMWMTLVTHVLALSLPWPDPDRPNTRTPWFVSLTWLLYSVAVPFSAITVVLSLMGYTEGSNHKLGQVLLVHWASAALMGASVLLNNYSYHILHVTFPMVRPRARRAEIAISTAQRTRARARAAQRYGRVHRARARAG